MIYSEKSYHGGCDRFVLNGGTTRLTVNDARTISLAGGSGSTVILPNPETLKGGYQLILILESSALSVTVKNHSGDTILSNSGVKYYELTYYAEPDKWFSRSLSYAQPSQFYVNGYDSISDQTVERPPLEADDCTTVYAEYVLVACDDSNERIYTNSVILDALDRVVVIEGSNTCYKVNLFRQEPPENTQEVDVKLIYPDCGDVSCISCPTDLEWNSINSDYVITFIDVDFYDCMYMAYPGGAHKCENKNLLGERLSFTYDAVNSDYRNVEKRLFGYAFQSQVGGQVRVPNKNNTCDTEVVAELSEQYTVFKPASEGNTNGKLTVHYKLDGSYGNTFNQYDLVFRATDIPYIEPGESIVVDNFFQFNQNWKLYNDVSPGLGDRRIVAYGGRALICRKEVVTYDDCGPTVTVQFNGMNAALRTNCLCSYFGQGSGAVQYEANADLDMTLSMFDLYNIGLPFTPSGYSRSDFCFYRTDYNSLPNFILKSIRSSHPDTPCGEAESPWLTDMPIGSNWSFYMVLWKETRSLAYCYWVSPKSNPGNPPAFSQITEPLFASGMSTYHYTTVQHYDVNYSGELVNLYCYEGEEVNEIDRPTDATVKFPGQYPQGSIIPNEVQNTDYSGSEQDHASNGQAYCVGGTMTFTVND